MWKYLAPWRSKTVLLLPFLGMQSLLGYPYSKESGGALVAQVLVWAPGALIGTPIYLLIVLKGVNWRLEMVLILPSLETRFLPGYPYPQESGGALVARVLF